MKQTNKKTFALNLTQEYKVGILATWIIGLFAHAYRFFNFLPIWDSMYNFTGTGATYTSGGCFLDFFSSLSSQYDMPWVNGALSLFYISLTVMLLIDLFHIRKTVNIVLLAGLIVSFPTITSSFAYMFTADGYMIAFFLAVAGIYLTWKYKYGILPGMLCIGLSLGTYQAYISVSLVLILLIVIRDILFDNYTFQRLLRRDSKYLLTVVGGAVFYELVSSIINWILGITLTDYQGINKMGILTLAQYREAFHKANRALMKLWCLTDGFVTTNKYALANEAIVCGIILGTFLLVWKKKIYKNIPCLIILVVAIIALPIAAYAVYFVSPDVVYHVLMEMGVSSIYLLLILYMEHGNWKTEFEKGLTYIGVLVLSFFVYFNSVNANIAYNSMNLSYEKSYGVCSNMLDRIEELDGYPELDKIAIIGEYHAFSNGIEDNAPYITGVSQDIFLGAEYHYLAMWNYCFGRQFESVDNNVKDNIIASEDYQNMPNYPASGSIRVINGIIVVKLGQ